MQEHSILSENLSEEDLGDRHLHGILNDRDFETRQMTSECLRIVAESEYVSTIAGQHLLFMFFNLSCRLYGVVSKMILDIPAVKTCSCYSQLGDSLPIAVKKHIRSIRGSLKNITFEGSEDKKDVLTVCLGFPNATGTFAYADDWNIYVGNQVQSLNAPLNPNPIGPFFGACILASEVYKRIARMRKGCGNFSEDFYYSVWSMESYSSWSEMPKPTAKDSFKLPQLHIVGAGAVGQAAISTIGLLQMLEIGKIIVIDHDHYDISNHNRCVLAVAEDIEEKTLKVNIVARFLKSVGIECAAVNEKWESFVYESPYRNKDFTYPWVFSCVDKNSSRHSIQSFSPEHIFGGSTVNMSLNVTYYQKGSGFECLKCNNKLEDVQTIEARGEKLKNLSEEELTRICKKYGADIELVKQYLEKPKCGSLGEAELQKFESTEIQSSVGFVSVAAGVAMVAKLIRILSESPDKAFSPSTRNQMFNFLKLDGNKFAYKARKDCDCINTLTHL